MSNIFALVEAILPTTNYPFAAEAALETQDLALAAQVLAQHQADLDKPEREGIRLDYRPCNLRRPTSQQMAHVTRITWKYDDLRKNGFLAF